MLLELRDEAGFRTSASGVCAGLVDRFGPDAEIRVGVRHPQDPLAELTGFGAPEAANGVIEVTLPQDEEIDVLIARSTGMVADLGDAVVPAGSIAVVGRARIIVEGAGPIFCAFVARRDPAITIEEMRRWWLHQHAPLACEIYGGLPPGGYGQLYVDRPESARLSAAIGIPYVPYDMGDSISSTSLHAFVDTWTTGEMTERAYQDEIGFLDHSSWRGAVFEVIART